MNLSKFPIENDVFIDHQDISHADLVDLNRYNELKLKSSLNTLERTELNTLLDKLRSKIFTAHDFNIMQDCMMNIQIFTRDKMETYIETKLAEISAQNKNWEAQMLQQKNSFDAKQSEIQQWYINIQNNLATMASFDFDNITALTGVTCDTSGFGTSIRTETIKNTGNNRNVAIRISEKISDTSRKITETVYNTDGVTVLRNKIVTWTKTANEWKGVVS